VENHPNYNSKKLLSELIFECQDLPNRKQECNHLAAMAGYIIFKIG
jgi:hypothetical protein